MRSVSALDVRKKFGQLLDEAAAGERLIIERAGQPVAALVPLSDVPELNREEGIRRRLQAIDDISRMARQRPGDRTLDAVTMIREQRRLRDEQIMRAVEQGKSKQE
jgi:prevent-host-death family protein